MATYTDISPEDRLSLATIARGCYQRALLDGCEAWSGATLRGRAKSYGYWYARSRANLITRIRAAGYTATYERRAHGRKVLVIR